MRSPGAGGTRPCCSVRQKRAGAGEEGLACGSVEGKTAACVAQVAWANLYEPPRPPEKRLEHLRRAMELTEDLAEPAAGYNVTYLNLALGATLEEHGERVPAVEA